MMIHQYKVRNEPHIIVRLSEPADMLSNDPNYTPGRLLDSLIGRFMLRNDLALARKLHLPHPCVSRVRHRKLALSAAIFLRIHEVTGIPIAELRDLAGMPSCLEKTLGDLRQAMERQHPGAQS